MQFRNAHAISQDACNDAIRAMSQLLAETVRACGPTTALAFSGSSR
jgi:hypothetical protein